MTAWQMRIAFSIFFLFVVFNSGLKSQTNYLTPQTFEELRDSLVGTWGVVELVNNSWGNCLPYFEYYQFQTLSIPTDYISDSLNNKLVGCTWDTSGAILNTWSWHIGYIPNISGNPVIGFIGSPGNSCDFYTIGSETFFASGQFVIDGSFLRYKRISKEPYGPCLPNNPAIFDSLNYFDTIYIVDTSYVVGEEIILDTLYNLDTTYNIISTIVRDTALINDTLLITETYVNNDTINIYSGIIKFQNSHHIKIYPNPVKNLLKLEIDCSILNNRTQLIDVHIYDYNGRIVWQDNRKFTDCQEQIINTEELEGGVYFIQITSISGDKYFAKFFKESY